VQPRAWRAGCSRISHRGGQARGGGCLKNVRFGVRLQSNRSSTSAPALRWWGYLVPGICLDRCRPFRGEPRLHPPAGIDGREFCAMGCASVNDPAETAGGALRDPPWLTKSRPVTGTAQASYLGEIRVAENISVDAQSPKPPADPHRLRGLPYLCLELLSTCLCVKKTPGGVLTRNSRVLRQ
jgi:hypothetical protein